MLRFIRFQQVGQNEPQSASDKSIPRVSMDGLQGPQSASDKSMTRVCFSSEHDALAPIFMTFGSQAGVGFIWIPANTYYFEENKWAKTRPRAAALWARVRARPAPRLLALAWPMGLPCRIYLLQVRAIPHQPRTQNVVNMDAVAPFWLKLGGSDSESHQESSGTIFGN